MLGKTPLEQFIAWWFARSDVEVSLLLAGPAATLLIIIAIVKLWKRRNPR